MSEWDKDGSAHDPAVSAIYRKAGDLTPPASLDDAILVAARQAASRRKQRWILPLSTAAVIMLSVSLLMNMHDEWDFSREQTDDSPEFRMAEKPKPVLPTVPQELAVEEEASPMGKAEVFAVNPAPADSLHIEAKAKKAAPSSNLLALDTPRPSKGTPAPSAGLTKQATRPTAESTGVRAFSDDFTALGNSTDKEAARMEIPDSPSSEPAQDIQKEVLHTERDSEDVLEPKPWLAKIRKLVAAGEKEAARKELKTFMERYPDHKVPEDLKSL